MKSEDPHTKAAIRSAQGAKDEADAGIHALSNDNIDIAEESAEEAAGHARAAWGHAHAAHALSLKKDPEAAKKRALDRWTSHSENSGGRDSQDAVGFSGDMEIRAKRIAARHGYSDASRAMEDAAGHHHRINSEIVDYHRSKLDHDTK